MVEKLVVDPQKSDTQNIVELTNKLNEVIELVGRGPAVRGLPPHMTVPTNTQHISYVESMLQRLESGPCKFLVQAEPTNDLVKPIGEALSALQAVVQVYKESLVKVEPEGG